MGKINKERMKMSMSDRAKQFAPFAALSGFEIALRKKEAEVEAKADLIERETSEEINNTEQIN